jgi:hypothetical protein
MLDGFSGAIGSDVGAARSAKKTDRVVDPRAIASKKLYPCPVCGAEFHLEEDVPQHIADTRIPDFGFRKGDAVRNAGNPEIAGIVEEIARNHNSMKVKVAGSGEVRSFVIMAVDGLYRGRVFWGKESAVRPRQLKL